MSYRVMIVDDHEEIRTLLRVIFSKTWAFRVIAEAKDGYDAIVALEDMMDDPPDLVLLDYMMPGMDGCRTLAHLKEMIPTLKVVFLTVVPDLAANCPSEGILDKTLLPSELVYSLFSLLDPNTTLTKEDL